MGINEVAERLGQKPQTIRAYARQWRLPKRQLVPSRNREAENAKRRLQPSERLSAQPL